MSKKRVLAIIGLAFMAVFSVTFVIWLAAPKFHNGVFGYTALFTGATGLCFLLVIKIFFKTKSDKDTTDYLPTPEKDETATDENIISEQLSQQEAITAQKEINGQDTQKKTP